VIDLACIGERQENGDADEQQQRTQEVSFLCGWERCSSCLPRESVEDEASKCDEGANRQDGERV